MEKKFKKELKNSKGFTLVELLVVIAIIGLLATMSVVALSSAREKARDARRLSDIKQIQTALEMYYSSAGSYPLTDDITPTNNTLGGSIVFSGQTFMQEIPSNPLPINDGACKEIVDNGENPSYVYNSDGTSYTIMYCLGASTNDVTEGTNCATPAGIASSTGSGGLCSGMTW